MDKSFYQMVERIGKEYAERSSFQWYSDVEKRLKTKTYAEYIQDAKLFAGYLMTIDPNIKGKHIAIAAQNSYHYAVLLLGTICSGAVAVLVNPQEKEDILLNALRTADASVLFSDSEKIRAHIGGSLQIPALKMNDYESQKELAVFSEQRPDTLAVLLFTSGTSGAQKCVMLSHNNLIAATNYSNYEFEKYVMKGVKNPIMGSLHMLPMYHVIGIVNIYCVLVHGDILNLCCDMRYLMRDNTLMQSDYTVVVPMILQMLYKGIVSGHPEVLGEWKSIITGGAKIDDTLADVFVEYGINLIQSYGMSETSGFGVYHYANDTRKYSALGKPGLDTEAKFINGELCLRGPLVMLGYYKNPDATAEVLQDGWMHTGDMGYIGEDGYIYLNGRKKNLIILSNGENVSPEELEALLLKNGSIREVLVKEKNDRICAEIFCDMQERDAIEAYINQMNKSLPYYKQIVLTEYRTEPFERTATGKIRRLSLPLS